MFLGEGPLHHQKTETHPQARLLDANSLAPRNLFGSLKRSALCNRRLPGWKPLRTGID
ncbi:hypothetical protein DPMN_001063 [Dreissena polymorpha]|uniref:Uncharacterized protein n=1 Tax=Dreissena polymorpha TaxID=45954 RepID=A0A9D4RSQ4_DREPO|nr:hypothetical protein DPMN_001063 [Dreissena polymorpha]